MARPSSSAKASGSNDSKKKKRGSKNAAAAAAGSPSGGRTPPSSNPAHAALSQHHHAEPHSADDADTMLPHIESCPALLHGDEKTRSSRAKAVTIKWEYEPHEYSAESPLGEPGRERLESGHVAFTNQKLLGTQGRVLMGLLKQFGSALKAGRSITTISVPVTVFEPRSFLERITDPWAFAEHFLPLAAKAKTPLARFQHCMNFLIAGLHLAVGQAKPFNPILGETFQAQYARGTQVYCEQVAHHPPVTAFHLEAADGAWRYWGRHLYQGSFGVNSLEGSQDGPNTIEFADGGKVTFNMPHCIISGIVAGQRTLKWCNVKPVIFEDAANHLRAELQFNPDRKGGVFSWVRTQPPCDMLRAEVVDTQADEVVSTLEGSFLVELLWDGATAWKLGDMSYGQPQRPKRPRVTDRLLLPSDSRWRGDLVELHEGNLDLAQQNKTILEEVQRRDRQLRHAFEKQRGGAGGAAGDDDAGDTTPSAGH